MVNKRLFIISDDVFGGYRIDVDIDEYNDLSEIVNFVVVNLCISLKNLNLEVLVRKCGEVNFHIHDVTFVEILMEENRDFYVCGHC